MILRILIKCGVTRCQFQQNTIKAKIAIGEFNDRMICFSRVKCIPSATNEKLSAKFVRYQCPFKLSDKRPSTTEQGYKNGLLFTKTAKALKN